MALKDDILSELTANGFVSGEYIAEKYFVSRNGVWKAVKKLRDEGYDIEAVTNKGYRLVSELNKISEGAIRSGLNSDWSFVILDEAVSTNNYAKELAVSGKKENTAVIAETQSGGRGRLGRVFYSPKGDGLYMSLLVRPTMPVADATFITSYTAVAVAKAIEKLCGHEVNIKWVNDIYMNGKKVCGILTEAGFDFEGGTLDYAVIGIGINVLGGEFPDELKTIATSIEKESGEKVSRNALAAEIMNNLSNIAEGITSKEYLKIYRQKSNVIGKRVHVTYGNETFDAEAVDIDDNAGLVVKTKDELRTLNSGEVSIKL
ncbi:MAG: biotin--[acetyl-CoA-carboxylase] ligase [Clostridiales bacterium]|nr:biotin--[acetyl-CoA-carboxylase] ligase [Clostridiales bacterium]